MVLYLFNLGQEEEDYQNVQELNKILFKGLLHHIEENILMRVVTILIMIGDHIGITGPLKEEGTKVIMEDHQIEDTTIIEDILGETIQVKMGDPLIMEDPLMMEDP